LILGVQSDNQNKSIQSHQKEIYCGKNWNIDRNKRRIAAHSSSDIESNNMQEEQRIFQNQLECSCPVNEVEGKNNRIANRSKQTEKTKQTLNEWIAGRREQNLQENIDCNHN